MADLPRSWKTTITDCPEFVDKEWVSQAIETLGYNFVAGIIYMKERTEKDGLRIEQSIDNEHWDIFDCFTVDDNEGIPFSVSLVGKWARVRIRLSNEQARTPSQEGGGGNEPIPFEFRLGVCLKSV